MFREARNEREDQRGRASCPRLTGPHFVGPKGQKANFVQETKEALARPMNKVRPGKAVKISLPSERRVSHLSWTPAQLCHSKMLQEGLTHRP